MIRVLLRAIGLSLRIEIVRDPLAILASDWPAQTGEYVDPDAVDETDDTDPCDCQ
ncbi:hypothetical protein [Nocardia bovistercoris]|uniref:Uncharacterized protein n=1 Tax=Nocardia bovistercoris TaxID=2785916 RepID=A0A931IE24_9NOCA|nr:hypothetical protein [Nocardia bovistercoris]MBH0778801.1 hypothetical protein [Nocardia bovistercoris]